MPACKSTCECDAYFLGPMKIGLMEANYMHILHSYRIFKSIVVRLNNSLNQPVYWSIVNGVKRLSFYMHTLKKLEIQFLKFLIFEEQIVCKHQKRQFRFQYHWRKDVITKICAKSSMLFENLKENYLAKQDNRCKNSPRCLSCAFKCKSFYSMIASPICPEIQSKQKI